MNASLKGLNDQFIKTYGIQADTPCIEKEIDAIELLSSKRFDFIAKYVYILYKEQGYRSDYAQRVYHHHIDILTQGSFQELGDSDKNSYEKFIEVFDQLIESIKTDGFDAEQSKVPLSNDFVPLNGAHRIACCLYFHRRLRVLCFPEIKTVNLNYQFFRKKGMKEAYLDFMAYYYSVVKSEQLYGCCIWPKALKQRSIQEIIQDFQAYGDIVYCKKINFSYQGLTNLMIELYGKEAWTGTSQHLYGGLHQKVEKCFEADTPFYYLLFEKKSDKTIREVKEALRSYFDLGTNSIHITDNHEECLQLGHLLLNEHSIHYLNQSDYLKKGALEKLPVAKKGALLDAASTLYLYGAEHMDGLHLCEACIEDDMEHDPDLSFISQGYRLMSLPYIMSHYPQYETIAKQLWEKEAREKQKGMVWKKLYGKLDYGIYIVLNRLHIYDKIWKLLKRD